MADTLLSCFTLPATPGRVFEAWTTPSIVQAWWGSPELFRTKFTHDLRVGGAWRAEFSTPDGQSYACFGEYRRLEPGHALAMTYQFSWTPDEAPVLAEFEFEPEGEVTIVALTQTGKISPEMREDPEGGWSVTLDFLRKYLGAPTLARSA